uniref:Lysozyme n=1 Tax=Spodoptera exigua TaxID=7107 RepID=A0A0G3DPZ8_SPOEX|nr:lysozyme-like protein 2 [Spodoptera exigua]
MRFALLILLVTSLVLCDYCESKQFTRCGLAKTLSQIKGMKKTFLGTWVCLIEKVSKRETTALTVKSNGKKAYGLYQIPSEWCKEGKRGGRCNIKCEALLDDDIRDDTACALKIMEEHGFQYWSLWTTRCKNDNFITNEIYKCPDLNRLSPERSLFQYRGPALRRRRSINRTIRKSRLIRSRRTNSVKLFVDV